MLIILLGNDSNTETKLKMLIAFHTEPYKSLSLDYTHF